MVGGFFVGRISPVGVRRKGQTPQTFVVTIGAPRRPGLVRHRAHRLDEFPSCAKRLGVRRAAPLWMKYLIATREESKAALRAALQGASRNALERELPVQGRDDLLQGILAARAGASAI